MPKSNKSQSRRSRSFGGCGTCRRRHVKCDRVRPICLTCKAVGATCEGFTAEIRWMPSLANDGSNDHRRASPDEDATNATRRHLYTESARERMTTASSFQVKSVDATLSDLDNRSKTKLGGIGEDIAVGPFGVLDFGKVSHAIADATAAVASEPAAESSPVLDTPITIDSLAGLDDSLQWADLFGFGSNGMFLENDMFDPMLDFSQNTSDMIFPDQEIASGSDISHLLPASHHALTEWNYLNSSGSSNFGEKDVYDEAQPLLRHFKDNVIRRWSSLPVTSKSPWGVVLLPEAICALAQLTFLGGNISSAKRANLCGILAISSYHLSKNASYDWKSDRRAE
ncbi:putative zn(2)-C6 fungal-type DNA-binding domain-containing protein [Septoria linicola]|nr:putative zn(2)-C6 fungal-type DNA-binding domain-containing protein [Septoria linicola]